MIKMVLIVKYQLELIIKGDDARSSSSLNDISLYLKQKKAWILRRKVLDSLCSRSSVVPFKPSHWQNIKCNKICVNGIFKKQKYKKNTASKYLVYYMKTV